MQKKFAQKIDEHNKYSDRLLSITNELMTLSQAELDDGNIENAEQIAEIAEKCTKLMADVSNTFEEEYGEELQLLEQIAKEHNKNEPEIELYLNANEQMKRRIVFVHCEDEEKCGFLVEFKHPNSTFFFCKEHGAGINLDLGTVPVEGVACPQHGTMERYDLVKDDNICPKCESMTIAVLSTGRDKNE